jgi:hypothetical protein
VALRVAFSCASSATFEDPTTTLDMTQMIASTTREGEILGRRPRNILLCTSAVLHSIHTLHINAPKSRHAQIDTFEQQRQFGHVDHSTDRRPAKVGTLQALVR